MHDCKLILAEVYEDEKDNKFYIKLVYTYKDNIGKHELTFPKVEIPFNQMRVPDITRFSESEVYLLIDKMSRLFEGSVYWSEEKHYFFDRITEPKIRRMTIGQIEEELGYQIEIVT